MEHSTAIMDDAGKAIAAATKVARPAEELSSTSRSEAADEDTKQGNDNWRKRKADSNLPHGSQRGGGDGHRGRGGRGGRGDHRGNKKRDMGRAEYFRDSPDKRQKTEASREKRLEGGKGPQYGMEFSKEEIDAEERRPKRKVAVMIGYSGTGYKGMQISTSEKTIEGDLFKAFVAAGAISKANADDPKKASLVRCARTDKGVHAAGNVVSLKLIVEDDDIVQRINDNLSPQIRVWGIQRTTGSFSCYQACDSRWYEYLIPTHAFLPPHTSSWLAKKLEEFADEVGDRVAYESRQAEVQGFWERADREYIDPIIAEIDEDIRSDVIKALRGEEEESAKTMEDIEDTEEVVNIEKSANGEASTSSSNSKQAEEPVTIAGQGDIPALDKAGDDVPSAITEETNDETDRHLRLRAATKKLRYAYATAKRRYRIPKQRIDRIQAALDKYLGTKNYHNYTVQMTFRDPSAKRHIKSFVVNPQPFLIGEGPDDDKSEWLSLKVHGQSFMMHQIRKMVSMITLLVRCGADLKTMDQSFTDARFSIPKVPGLGLLLERPVFDSYNERQAAQHDREKIDFRKYDKEMDAFKESEIYQRIFREEEERNEFGKWFNHVDNFKDPHFLFVTSKGVDATKMKRND